MITELDFRILDSIQAILQCKLLDFLMPKITLLGEFGILFILLGLMMLLFPKLRLPGAACMLALLLDVILVNGILKNIFQRPRPYDLRQFTLLIKPQWDTSFPSGHTGAAFAFAVALLTVDSPIRRKAGIPAIILAALIGFSRLYLYMHFPTDVIAGAVCGVLCGLAGGLIAVRIARKSCKFDLK